MKKFIFGKEKTPLQLPGIEPLSFNSGFTAVMFQSINTATSITLKQFALLFRFMRGHNLK